MKPVFIKDGEVGGEPEKGIILATLGSATGHNASISYYVLAPPTPSPYCMYFFFFFPAPWGMQDLSSLLAC